MKVGSLFSGIGGFDLGLERAGFEIAWQVEIDPWCRRVLDKHWPTVPIYEDVKEVDPEGLEPVDIIAGGFPCQPVSNAGKREGIHDERWLWPQFHRIIRSLRPRWVLVENVPGLFSVNSGRGFGEVLWDLAQSGYHVEWDCLPAAAFGARHIRRRIWLLAHSNGPERGREIQSGKHQPDREVEGWKEAAGRSSLSGGDGGVGPLADADSLRRLDRESEGSVSGGEIQRHSSLTEPSPGREPLAHANSGEEGALEIAPRDDANRCREHLADPAGQGLEGCWRCGEGGIFGGQRCHIASIYRSNRETIWSVLSESRVQRVAHGVPRELDLFGGLDEIKSSNSEGISKKSLAQWKILRAMWEYRELAKASPEHYESRLRDIVPDVSYQRTRGGWFMGAWIETNKELCDLWMRFYSKSFEEAQDLQQELLKRIRSLERTKEVGPAKDRIHRLRGLGNAVVPQIVEWLGRRILDVEQRGNPP